MGKVELPFEVEIGDMAPALLLGLLEDGLWLDGHTIHHYVPAEETDPNTGVPIPFPVGESHRETVTVNDSGGVAIGGIDVLRIRLNTVRLSAYAVTDDQDAAGQFAAALESVLADIGVLDEPAGADAAKGVEPNDVLAAGIQPEDLHKDAWKAAGYERDDLFDWWFRWGRIPYSALDDLAPMVGVAKKTLQNNLNYYRARAGGDKPLPDDESKFSGKSSRKTGKM